MHRFPATSGEHRGVDILDGPRGEHIGGRNAATPAVLMDGLRALRIEVGSSPARSRLAGIGPRWSGDHRRDHVGQPLVLIDAKALFQDAETRSLTCGNVGVGFEGPNDNLETIGLALQNTEISSAKILGPFRLFSGGLSVLAQTTSANGGRTPTWLRDAELTDRLTTELIGCYAFCQASVRRRGAVGGGRLP